MKSADRGLAAHRSRPAPRSELELIAAEKADARAAMARELCELRNDVKAAPGLWYQRHVWWATGAALTAGVFAGRAMASAARRKPPPPSAPPPAPRSGGLLRLLRASLPQTAELLRTIVTGIIGGQIVTRVQERSAQGPAEPPC
jgi:hypothetical protein